MHLLFDIGGTNTRLGISLRGKRITQVLTFVTPRDFHKGIAAILKASRRLLNGAKPRIVSGGVAGVVNPKYGICGYSPNLKQWAGKPLYAELKKIFGTRVLLENDAALAGLGEALIRQKLKSVKNEIIAYLTFSTGVGGARIVDGKIDKKVFGFEPGAAILDYKNEKTLEDLTGGANVMQAFLKQPRPIKDAKFWDKAAKAATYGIHNVIMHWSPDVVILGGAMILKKPGIQIKQIRLCLSKISHVFPKLPKIEKAALGDLSGLYGALFQIQASKPK